MPRRLAVAKHAGGFDAVGWTLLGFLLGASLAVFALLHADIHGGMPPFASGPAEPSPPPAAASAVVTYAAPTPAAPPNNPPPAIEPIARIRSAPAPTPSAPKVDALAVAGAASVHAAGKDARTRPDKAPSSAGAQASPTDPQVDADAAAAGMTSRAGPPGAQAPRAASLPDLY